MWHFAGIHSESTAIQRLEGLRGWARNYERMTTLFSIASRSIIRGLSDAFPTVIFEVMKKKKKKWREGRFLPSSMSLPLCSLWEISETTSIHFPWQQQQLKYTRRVVVKGVVINFVEGFVHERELDWNWNSNFSIGFRPVRLDQFHLS